MQVDLEQFRMSPATDVVGLGPLCATSYNLRRHFDFSEAFPFDWWVTNGNSITAALSKLEVDYIYDLSLLEVTEDRHTVCHKELGILLHHEFPRGPNYPSGRSGPILDNIGAHISIPKARTRHLISKFNALNCTGKRILFVREGADGIGIESELNKLFPLATWCIQYIPTVVTDANHGWQGNPAEWDKHLSGLQVEYMKGGGGGFSDVTADDENLVEIHKAEKDNSAS
jgi:hypothetical protein